MTATARHLTPTRRRLRVVRRQAKPLYELPDWSIDWKRDRWSLLGIVLVLAWFWIALEFVL